MKNFKTFNLAVEFYRAMRALRLPGPEQDQCRRAALSIALNLAEGRGKSTLKDQLRFFSIAMGSVRECQAILLLCELQGSKYWALLDSLAASLFKLIRNAK